MANEKNLIPLSQRSQRERKEIARMGAIASNKKQAEHRKLREEFAILLENEDMRQRICTALIQQALRGNVKAFEVIRDTIGEKPSNKLDLKADTDFKITIEYAE